MTDSRKCFNNNNASLSLTYCDVKKQQQQNFRNIKQEWQTVTKYARHHVKLVIKGYNSWTARPTKPIFELG